MLTPLARSWRALTVAAALALLAMPVRAQQPGAAQPAPLRIAYVNSAFILANTPGRAQAESTFTREMQGFRAEVQRLQAELDSAVATYTRARAAMTPQAQRTREDELRQMEQRTRQRASELEQQAQQREQELMAPILQRVNAVIEGIRAEFNYSFIFDVAAQGAGIISADRTFDISPLVIQRLQAGGAPPALPGETPAAIRPPAAPRPAAADTTRPVPSPLTPRGRRP